MNVVQVAFSIGLSLILAACKIEVDVPRGGRVKTVSSAYLCRANDTCVIDVVDTFFDETFQAIPNDGYKFTAWRTRPGSFCGGSNKDCYLSTAGFTDPALVDVLESDTVYYFEPVFGRPNTWINRAETSTAGAYVSTCSIRGKLYAVGLGWGDPASSLGRVEVYDPVSDNWELRSDIPTSRSSAAAAVFKNRCYVIGGANSGGPLSPPALSAVEIYDPETDTWTSGAPLPEPRGTAGSAVVKGKIYLVGGSKNIWWAVEQTAAIDIYDPKKDKWSRGADMPTPRQGMGVAAVDGLIYAVGGSNHELGLYASKIVERYDPATDKWTRVADLPQARDFLTAVALDGKLYALGGVSNSASQFDGNALGTDTVFRYDPKIDKWVKRADMQKVRHGPGAGVIDGQIYVLGGSTSREGMALTDTEQYTP